MNESESKLSNERVQDKEFVRHALEDLKQARVNRWRNKDDPKFVSEEEYVKRKETDLEHVGAMKIVAELLFQKAEVEEDHTILDLDYKKVMNLIRIHDLEENYTGDERSKDEAYYEKEKEATSRLESNNQKVNFGRLETNLIKEYKSKESPESHFVKALDELQAWLHLISKRSTQESNRNHFKLDENKGYIFAQEFPTMKRVMDIVVHVMQRPGLINSPVEEMSEEID